MLFSLFLFFVLLLGSYCFSDGENKSWDGNGVDGVYNQSIVVGHPVENIFLLLYLAKWLSRNLSSSSLSFSEFKSLHLITNNKFLKSLVIKLLLNFLIFSTDCKYFFLEEISNKLIVIGTNDE